MYSTISQLLADNSNKTTMSSHLRVIISGGGTGGHIFPAISIANEIKAKRPDAEILFVGAKGRMEMQRVPAAGYTIKALPLNEGMSRANHRINWHNVRVAYKYVASLVKARRIVADFKPHVAVGVGGYVSAATLDAAGRMGVPTLLQEQNSFAGVTNRKLAARARKICVAYEGMERFFPADRILLTGNPVRQNLVNPTCTKAEAIQQFGLDPTKRTILVIGGSLGAKTLNDSILNNLDSIADAQDIQILWQTGKYYSAAIQRDLAAHPAPANLKVTEFVTDMAAAFTAADLVISRAGASSISELCLLGKPAILVPSPNVAEDHQTHNAMALVNHDAALHIRDVEARKTLIPTAFSLVRDDIRLATLGNNVRSLGRPNAASDIADEVIRLANI